MPIFYEVGTTFFLSDTNDWEYMIDKFPYFEYKLHEVNYEENRLILTFYNSIQQAYSIGVLSFNDEMKVYKMVTSYV